MTGSPQYRLKNASVERGFVLLSVVLAITLIALVALDIGNQGATQVSIAAGELQRDELRYVAEAGMAHANWQLAQNSSCTNYTSLPPTPFGSHSYSASLTPTSGSPISVAAQGTLVNGAQYTLQSDQVAVYGALNVLTLQPDATVGKDTHIYQWKSAWNYGTSVDLRVENRIAGDWSNALFEFNVSTIPAAAKIIGATLFLNQSSPAAGGGDFSVHRVTSTWVEGVMAGGNGSPNWANRDTGAAWTTPGGDYDPAAVATINIPAGLLPHQWEVVSLVQRWVSGESANYGMAIVPASFGSDALFHSSDGSNATLRPKLTITYACECGQVCAEDPNAPYAHWKLDETIGTNAADAVGGHDGTLTNGPGWATGQIEGALDFDGIDDYVDVGTFDVSGSGITMLGWFNVEKFSIGDAHFLSKATSPAKDDTWWQFSTMNADGDYHLRMRIKAGGVADKLEDTSVHLSTAQWYFGAATYDAVSGEMKIYLDGVEIASAVHAVGGAVDAGPTVLVAIGANGTAERFFDGMLDDVRIYDRALSAVEVSDLFIAGGGSSGGTPGYNEAYAPWSATIDDNWGAVDLARFGVPANAVVEVAIVNSDLNDEYWGGVREIGSSLDRRIQLHEAESGGTDVMIMHVQADANSNIEHYSDKKADLTFVLLGYWGSGTFVEAWDFFNGTVDGEWASQSLGGWGVTPGSVAEVLMVNQVQTAEKKAGVRSAGSSVERLFTIDEAEGGGGDMLTLVANTSSDASASVEVYMTDSSIKFYLLGHWSSPPGSYIESAEPVGKPSTSAAWESVKISDFDVPTDSIANIVMFNAQSDAEAQVGVRSVGSSLARVLDLQEAEGGGSDLVGTNANVDSDGQIEWYDESTQSHEFWVVGWWILNP